MTGVFTVAHTYLIRKCVDQAGGLSNDVGAMKNYGFRFKSVYLCIHLFNLCSRDSSWSTTTLASNK